MRRFIVLITLLSCLFNTSTLLVAQILPKNNDILNYTHIAFDFPAVDAAAYYQLSFTHIDETVPFHIQIDSTNVSFCNNFSYGNQYRWNYEAFDSYNKSVFKSKNFAFSVIKNTAYDSLQYAALCRGDYNTGLFTNDFSKNVMDWNGTTVWQFPKLNGSIFTGELNIRDLRITRKGTFTCLITNGILIEFDRNGNILWIAPGSQVNGQKTKENYHHDFKQLTNGNFLTLSEEEYMVPLKLSKTQTKELRGKENIFEKDGKLFVLGNWATIVEYDKSGQERWRWRSGEYFAGLVEDGWKNADTHANAFFLDEKNDILYVGFRNVSLIVKIDRKTKKVLHSYGSQLSLNQKVSLVNEIGLQHSIEKNSQDQLIIFNNNFIEEDSSAISTILFVDENSNHDAKTVNTFECLIDKNDNGKALKYGSAEELPDKMIFIGIGALGRVVVMNPYNKNEILKDIIFKSYQNDVWSNLMFYRCHYVPSLYPTYYSCKKNTNGFEVNNEGQYDDIYKIELTLKNGKTILLSSPSISQGEKFNYVLENKDVMSVKIQSTYLPELERTLTW